MALTLHPVPGKAKSKMLCEAFAAGAPKSATGHVFAGVKDNNHAAWQHVQAKGLEYWFVDGSYFDKVRGQQFRIERNRIQHNGLGESDCKRFDAMGIPVLPWREGKHVLAIEQSPLFMRVIAEDPGWLDREVGKYTKPGVRVHLRPWNSNKPTLALSFATELKDAGMVVTHTSAAAIGAVLAGVNVTVSEHSAARVVQDGRVTDRRQWAGVLADTQFAINEMKDGTAWRMLNK